MNPFFIKKMRIILVLYFKISFIEGIYKNKDLGENNRRFIKTFTFDFFLTYTKDLFNECKPYAKEVFINDHLFDIDIFNKIETQTYLYKIDDVLNINRYNILILFLEETKKYLSEKHGELFLNIIKFAVINKNLYVNNNKIDTIFKRLDNLLKAIIEYKLELKNMNGLATINRKYGNRKAITLSKYCKEYAELVIIYLNCLLLKIINCLKHDFIFEEFDLPTKCLDDAIKHFEFVFEVSSILHEEIEKEVSTYLIVPINCFSTVSVNKKFDALLRFLDLNISSDNFAKYIKKLKMSQIKKLFSMCKNEDFGFIKFGTLPKQNSKAKTKLENGNNKQNVNLSGKEYDCNVNIKKTTKIYEYLKKMNLRAKDVDKPICLSYLKDLTIFLTYHNY